MTRTFESYSFGDDECICEECGKIFQKYTPDWAYKLSSYRKRYFCSYGCMQKYKRKHEGKPVGDYVFKNMPKTARRDIPMEKIEEAYNLWKSGRSQESIALEMGISATTLNKRFKMYKAERGLK